jgi:hypothetical protein
MTQNPLQPVIVDDDGVHRFKANKIVQYLLDTHPTVDMNHLAVLRVFSQDDREQFAQLIGYSVSGICDLSYVSDRVADYGLEESEKLRQENEKMEMDESKHEGTHFEVGCPGCSTT